MGGTSWSVHQPADSLPHPHPRPTPHTESVRRWTHEPISSPACHLIRRFCRSVSFVLDTKWLTDTHSQLTRNTELDWRMMVWQMQEEKSRGHNKKRKQQPTTMTLEVYTCLSKTTSSNRLLNKSNDRTIKRLLLLLLVFHQISLKPHWAWSFLYNIIEKSQRPSVKDAALWLEDESCPDFNMRTPPQAAADLQVGSAHSHSRTFTFAFCLASDTLTTLWPNHQHTTHAHTHTLREEWLS